MASGKPNQFVVRVGTRGSALAVTQSSWVIDRLAEAYPEHQFELVTISTKGDRILDRSLNKIGDKGLFVKEIEEALLQGAIDLAVHSAKDLPGVSPEGLVLGAFPKREDPRDALICREAGDLEDLGDGALIGTSSLRRAAQLKHYSPSFTIVPVRGNIDTRLRRLHDDRLDAIVLAAAGLKRMGWQDRITTYLDPEDVCVPAAGQGVLAVQCREDDAETRELLSVIDHPETRACIEAERAYLRALEGGCQVPMGGYAQVKDDDIVFVGIVAGLDGEPTLRVTRRGPREKAEAIGRECAQRLLELGARELIVEAVAREVEIHD